MLYKILAMFAVSCRFGKGDTEYTVVFLFLKSFLAQVHEGPGNATAYQQCPAHCLLKYISVSCEPINCSPLGKHR